MSTQTETQQKFAVSKDIPVPRGEVQSKLVFYAPPEDGSVPFNYIEKPPEGLPQVSI